MGATAAGVVIKGNTFIVTGGASGLGLAAATRLAAEGGKVALWDSNADAGDEAVKEIGADRAAFFEADVTSEESIKKALVATAERFTSIRGVVNCAGVAAAALTVGRKDKAPHDMEMYNRVISINLSGTSMFVGWCVARAPVAPCVAVSSPSRVSDDGRDNDTHAHAR